MRKTSRNGFAHGKLDPVTVGASHRGVRSAKRPKKRRPTVAEIKAAIAKAEGE
jgi:hypothetical protein